MGTGEASGGTARRVSQRVLAGIERWGNRLPDPVTIFVALALLALVASWIAGTCGVAVVNPATGEMVRAVNLLDGPGIRRILVNVVPNFTGFAPLGTVLVAMIGIGVAERTGLFAALLKALVTAVPRGWVTPTLIFAGIMSNTAADAGYVILPPLAALLYASMRRHPLAGLAAVFAGIGGGFSANLLLSSLDPLLAGLSTEAAHLLDPAYTVQATASYYLMAVSVVLLTVVGTVVSNRIVEPWIGPWKPDDSVATEESLEPLTRLERRGLWWALVATVVTVGAIALLVIPAGAPLRDAETGSIAPFYDSLVALLAIFFMAPGLTYGLVTRQVRSDRDTARMMSDTMAAMGTYIVMAFFAGQFIAYFNWSNLGLIIAISGAEALKSAHLTGVPLMVGFIFVAATINLFMASASAKWAIMAPVFVPMLMVLGWSPETTQGLYRVGDSITNTITPLNYYLPIIIAVGRRYMPKLGMGTLLAAMLPYAVAFGLFWTVLVVAWVVLGVPIGPGAPLHYAVGGG
ncbi:MAG TPA: AbgT family transporter [Phycisphaerae bacterium]|nr:AbgT family transporter [Phycisphaerae bacterium]